MELQHLLHGGADSKVPEQPCDNGEADTLLSPGLLPKGWHQTPGSTQGSLTLA